LRHAIAIGVFKRIFFLRIVDRQHHLHHGALVAADAAHAHLLRAGSRVETPASRRLYDRYG